VSAFLLRRFLWMIPTTLGIALVIFGLLHAVPGDPALVAFASTGETDGGGGESGVALAAFRREHGLDRSLPVQLACYLGPFNLLRDGHPWFRSPCPERVVEHLPLADGAESIEGIPVELEPLAGTTPEDLASVRASIAALESEDASGWAEARRQLGLLRESALPLLLDALADAGPRDPGALDRLRAALEDVSRHKTDLAAERVETLGPVTALVRHWYGWYYTHEGSTVVNSGERPWGGLLALDLGRELHTGASVAREIARRLAVTVPLALVSVLLAFLVAVPLGILSAWKRGGLLERSITCVLYLLHSLPAFWGGLLLVMLFGVTGPDLPFWPRLPVLGLHDKDADLLGRADWTWDLVRHSILPVLTMTYGSLAYLARQTRSGMIEVLGEDFVRALRARGLGERTIVLRHVFRSALVPLVTLLGSLLPALIGGSVIVETIFDLPGVGKYAYEGLLRRDLPVVMACTLLLGVLTQLGVLLSDVLYGFVDPRIRHG
jgi:peptide/nickel transport system permease protein